MKTKFGLDAKKIEEKKSGGKKKGPAYTAPKNKKKQQIFEFYYMIPAKLTAKELSLQITVLPEDKIEIWLELNLMEVVMTADSLIFQDAWDCFEDPLDLEFIEGHGFKTIFQISYDTEDTALVRKVMKELLEKVGGLICSDTDTFEPSYNVENVIAMGETAKKIGF